MVEFANFDHGPMELPLTKTNMSLIELLQKHDGGYFLRADTEAVLQKPVPRTSTSGSMISWPSAHG